MSSAAPDWLIGSQSPRLSHVPEGDVTQGDRAVEFCRLVGMTLYPWQEDLLRDMCRTTGQVDGRNLWSARECVLPVARQNGKGEVLVARELVGIYLFGEQVVLHTAHFLDTAIDARDRLWEIISENDDLMDWWLDEYGKRPQLINSNGKEGIIFPNKAHIRYRTRTKKTGRGLSVELLVLDECFDMPTEVYNALESLTKARPNSQKIFISSAVNRFEHAHGAIFSAKRWAALDGARGVLFKEWSPDPDIDAFSFDAQRQANPSLVSAPKPGVQLAAVEMEAESAKKSRDLLNSYLVETLNVGNWVPRDGDDVDFEPIIDIDAWQSAVDESPRLSGESCLAVDVGPSADVVSVVSASQTDRGVHLSVAPIVEFDRDRVVDGVVRVRDAHDPVGVWLDPKSAASTLEGELLRHNVEPEKMSWSTVTSALELFLTMFREGRISHDGDPRWVAALNVAVFRSGNSSGRALTRADGDISVLTAATFAVHGLEKHGVIAQTAHRDGVKRDKREVGMPLPVLAGSGPVRREF
ncbi:hypothetical protein QP933_06845 [Corynebacterium pseudodiphtheriticum]|uniref:hypothetical protein n=1 Tax=Corynebacterium pseudodiphtheriticum TaxID=37637 RepID=UPI00254AFF22|nr:hypothetical protein [Corynebacterium pseudodiphtheriticum]MDK8500656.1 hypothetical protein [Corynebacterium pseudodiphtheriticum]MDK8775785.1 hypothetical protein [Corynebacterium pseudodiphtheriticum]